MMHIHGRRMKGLFDDRASCLFDLVSVITHINLHGYGGFLSLPPSYRRPLEVTPHACGHGFGDFWFFGCETLHSLSPV